MEEFLCKGVRFITNRTKFNVDKNTINRTYNGLIFDSILEMKYYRDVLCAKVKSGDIVKYELQKPYELQPKFIYNNETVQPIKYVADFFIVYKDGHEEVVDIKGYPDSVAILKRKLFWYHYPTIDYKWICYSKTDGGWCEFEYVKTQRAERKRNKNKNLEGKK